ncbi:mitochondrial dicarboxylate carrier [Leptidea sinapis]|uniref:mitochondrial dicarboxylate carrier n=1 Tax=Leptidea sinapis TaxID=189913 RepID=UPI0021398AAE|nr:mitochondrial dicarboxylate carrier [Leptidea sinapis]XP_050667213.1 mitochondrial dicarboxylate carrier [Leptidea sinapis]XP_050667215.1 mitochondrial dicarboxylate carrier [Leptidea sinapis]XP_050667216.1 mitochondrial dicarboxylate carrier [Leptidea sinapis]XP_050667217.1 mitochondrial dicarboxylate carrier [Leptidea sinapis]XP_050667218.1 mitochondrial dicarboxylate carrier [Leptidea sinapis]
MTETKVSHWYFGGLASAGAACVTHPLDLLKVQMQTQKGKNISMFKLTTIVLKNQGIMGLYNGISASLLRQMTYSTARFGIYEAAKQNFAPKDGSNIPFYMSAFLAGLGGLAGGFVGTPADLVNVRMQNDVKLPPEQRRNYKNAIHGLYRVVAEEGVLRLWAGSSMACSRAVLMTIGQLSFYDSIKELLLSTPYFEDNVGTHVCSSLFAGGIATTMTQPADVLKTRAMNAKPGEFSGILHLMTSTAKEGPLAFFKGYIPAFVRLAPHTILTFVFLEQLRINFGFTKRDSN